VLRSLWSRCSEMVCEVFLVFLDYDGRCRCAFRVCCPENNRHSITFTLLYSKPPLHRSCSVKWSCRKRATMALPRLEPADNDVCTRTGMTATSSCSKETTRRTPVSERNFEETSKDAKSKLVAAGSQIAKRHRVFSQFKGVAQRAGTPPSV
jgi:hypothetical protein